MIRRILNKQARLKLDQRIAETEKKTGAQVVLAVVERSDSYAEIPWKAFALGVALSGFIMVSAELLHPVWPSNASALPPVLLMLAAGVAAALLCVGSPLFARFFLDSHRAALEVRQYAQSMFLERELFGTSQRAAILILISLFERSVVVLPDTGINKRLSAKSLQSVVDRITQTLASKRLADAFEEGLSALEEILAATAPAESGKNELPDEIIEEKGT
jgi:putative membrane protein